MVLPYRGPAPPSTTCGGEAWARYLLNDESTSPIEVKVKMIKFSPSLISRCLISAAIVLSGVCAVSGATVAGDVSPVAVPQSVILPSVARPVAREPLIAARLADLFRPPTLAQ